MHVVGDWFVWCLKKKHPGFHRFYKTGSDQDMYWSRLVAASDRYGFFFSGLGFGRNQMIRRRRRLEAQPTRVCKRRFFPLSCSEARDEAHLADGKSGPCGVRRWAGPEICLSTVATSQILKGPKKQYAQLPTANVKKKKKSKTKDAPS